MMMRKWENDKIRFNDFQGKAPRQAASCTGKIQKKWTSYREKYLESLEIQEGATTFAPQTLNLIERLSEELIQQKQGLRENDSTFLRDRSKTMEKAFNLRQG